MGAAFSRQATPFITAGGVNTGLRGHDFNQWPGEPPQWEFLREATKPGVVVLDVPPENGEPVTSVPRFDAYHDPPSSALVPGPAFRTARPPAKQIRTPVSRP